MACAYNAPNGKPSKVFDDIYQSNGLATAVANYEWFNSPAFADWYGTGRIDENGEPIIEQGLLTNAAGETASLISANPPLKEGVAKKQADELQAVFAKHGININLIPDKMSADEGYVVNVDGNIKLVYNPAKAKADSIFHEFGHVYVDLIGYNDPMIQRGIAQVRNTDLWNQIAKRYPELNEEQLGKEVLTTAIGIEAARRHDPLHQYINKGKSTWLDKLSGWLFWANQFFRRIGELLGIHKDVASKLAYDLTSGKLRNRLTGTVATYVQRKKVDIADIVDALSTDTVLSDDGTYYTLTSDPSVKMDRITNAIHKLQGAFDREAAMRQVARSQRPLYAAYNTEEEVAKLWADKREEGTGIHGIAERYILNINAASDRAEARKDILANLHRPENAGQLDEDGVRIYGGMNRPQVEGYVDTILDFLDSLYAKGYRLFAEVRVSDEELGVAGTIDLLAVAPDGTIEIFDFKTKEVTSVGGDEYSTFDNFNTIDTAQPNFLLFMSDISNTKRNQYALQLSAYKLILERYGLEVSKLHIVPLIGEIVYDMGQYNYTNLRLYKSSTVRGFNGNTFELPDFSARLEAGWLGKDDTEALLAEAALIDIMDDRYEQRLKDIANLKNWIKESIVDLRRSIGRVTAQADKDTATQYKNKVEALIERLLVDDEFEVVATYTEFLTNELFRLRKKLFTRLASYRSGTEKIIPGYATLTWQQIKQMEKEAPNDFADFIGFLANSQAFIDQIVHIQELPFTATDELGTASNLLLRALKDLEPDISDIQFHLNRLNRELDVRYFELSSNPLYQNGDALKALEMFMAAQKDETWMQANMDALGDTHHAYIANVIKAFDLKEFDRRQEVEHLIDEWRKRSEGRDLRKFQTADGSKLINQINWAKYYEDMEKMYTEAEKLGRTTNQYRKYVNNWFLKNTVRKTEDELTRMKQRKLKELGSEEYKVWNTRQHYYREDEDGNGRHYESNRGAYFKPNPGVYEMPEYTALTPDEQEFLNYMQNTLFYLVDHVKDSIVEGGYIPAVPLDERTAWEQIKAGLGWHDAHKMPTEGLFNRDGEMIYTLPFKFNSLLNQEEYESIFEEDTPDVKSQKRERNREIAANNRAAHAAAIETDLSKVMPLFIQSAMKHKYRKVMEFEMLRVQRSMINNHKIIFAKNGLPFVDKYRKMTGLANDKVEKTTANSKILDHYKDWLKMIFYEKFEMDEGNWTKIARVLQNYTSFKGLALNPLAAVNNVVYGKMMSRIESAAGEFYSPKDWLWSKGVYDTNIHNFFADREAEGNYSSKASAFTDKFRIMMDVRETDQLDNSSRDVSNRVLKAVSWGMSKAYGLQQIGEHMMQNRLLFSMAHSHRIVNGRILSFNEFKRGKLEKVDALRGDKEANKAIMESNKAKLAELKTEWNTMTRLYDAYDFIDGQLVLKPEFSEIPAQEFAEFERRVLGVNQYIHGIYNKEDAGAMQQYALGRLAIQFRKWMRPGWTKRWGTRAGEEFWNERRKHTDAGYYVTTVKFLGRPITKFFEDKKAAEEAKEQFNTLKAFGNIFKDYVTYFTRAKVHWASLEEHEKAGVIRTALEWAALCTAVGLLYALKSLKAGDEEPPEALMLALYQLDRTVLELTTYVPIGFVPGIPGVHDGFIGGGFLNEGKKMLKSPTATFNTVEQLFKVGKHVMTAVGGDSEDLIYKSGVYHGQNKLTVELKKMIPLYNQWFRIQNLDKNYKYYQLF